MNDHDPLADFSVSEELDDALSAFASESEAPPPAPARQQKPAASAARTSRPVAAKPLLVRLLVRRPIETAPPEQTAVAIRTAPLPAPRRLPPIEVNVSPLRPRWHLWSGVACAVALGAILGLAYARFVSPAQDLDGPSSTTHAPAPSNQGTRSSRSAAGPASVPAESPLLPAVDVDPLDPKRVQSLDTRDASGAKANTNASATTGVRDRKPVTPSRDRRGTVAIPTPGATPLALDSLPASEAAVPVAPAIEEPAPPEPAAAPDDRQHIRAVLDAYRGAYERRDVVAAASLWPGVDTRALNRAFGTIASQNVMFDRCAIDVSGLQATAECRGAIHYVRRVGDAAPQSRAMSWTFQLDRSSGQWRIGNMVAR